MSKNPYDEILSGYFASTETPATSGRGVADYKPRTLSTGNPQYDAWYDTYGKKHNVDPDLLIAQGKQESGFRSNAKSPAGAQGIAQFMPATAKEFGVNPADPESSINGQSLLMGKLLDRTKDPELALAGYNSGHNASIQRLRRNRQRIPETRGYVDNILGTYKKANSSQNNAGNVSNNPYADILDGFFQQDTPQDTPPADIPQSAPPPTNPVDVMPTQTQLPPPPTPMGVNDQLMPEGLSTRPAPESPDTLKAQMQAALNPKVKDRSAVLTTEPSQNAIFQNSGFTPIQVQQGTLWVNPAKARKLKLRTPQDIQMFVENNPDGMTRLIGKVENVGDNTGGNQPVVHTTAPDGTELSSSVVTNPEAAAKQVDVDKKSFPDSRTQVTTTDQVALKRQQGTQATAPPQKVNFDAQAFQQANDYLKSQGQPELTKEQFLATQQVQGNVTPSLKAEDFNIGDKKITDYEPEKTVDGGTIRFPREMGKPSDANGVVATYTANEGLSQEDAFKKSLLEAGAKYGITPQQVNDRLATIKASGNPILQGWDNGKGVKNVIDVTWDDLKKAGVDVDNARRMEQAQTTDNTRLTPDLSPLPNAIDEGLKNAKEAFKNLPFGDEGVALGGAAVNATLPSMAGTLGGVLSFINDLSPTKGESIPESLLKGGVTDKDGNPVPLQKVREDSLITSLRDFYDAGNELQQKSQVKDANGNETLPSMLVQIVGRTPGDLAKLGVLSMLPGGIVTAMGVDSAALERLRTKDPEKLMKATEKGLALGALFALTGTAGKIATDVTGTVLNKAVSPLFTKGVEVATIGGGSYAIGTAFGDPVKDKLQSAFVNSIFHIVASSGNKAEGKTFRMQDENGNVIAAKIEDGKVISVDPNTPVNVEMYLPRKAKVTETTLKPIDTEKVTKPADKLSEDFASQPEKGFQITGGKSDNPAIVSPEENAAKLAKKATENAPETSANSSSESTASQEAINRLESEKNAGLTRVVVDTRSKTERPLIGVDAVDYTPKPHESVEYRGGGRNGEVIAQGDKVSPAYSPPERDVATKTEAKPETKTAEPDVYEINADELANEKPQIRQTGSAETFVGASATGNNQSQNNITPEYAQQRGVTITSTSDHPQKDLMARSPETFFKNGRQDGYYIQDFDNGRRLFNPTTGEIITFEASDKKNGTSLQTAKIFAANYAQENPVIERDIPAGEIKRTAIFNKPIEIKEGSTVYNASGKEGEVVGKDGDNLLVQWTKPNGEMDGEPVPVRPDKVSTTKATAETNVAEKPVETKTVEKPVETKPLAKGQKVTYLGKEWEIAADPVNGKVTLKDSTGRGKLVSVDKVVPAEGLPDTQIKDILGDEPVTPKNAMAKAEEIVNAEDQRSSSQNEGNVTANESKGGSESAIEKPNTPLTESKTDAIPKPSEPIKGESPKPIETGNAKAPVQDLKVFEKNKIFTPDAVAKARERLAKKGTQFNAGLDPETLHDLGVIGGAYIEAGARNFGEFASKMKADIKGISDDVLKQVYELVHKTYGDKIPNLEPPEGTKEVKQSERGSSKIGLSIEQKAIEQGLTEGFPETAGYDKKYRDDQIQRVEKVITQDYDMARRMALGLEPIPHEVSPVMLLRGMEEVAKARKDVQLQYELANSPLVSETSRHAQEMRFMQEREQDSATTALQAIRRERIAQTQKVLKGRTVEEAIKQEAEKLASTMKRSVEHVKRQIKTQGAWDKFLSEIEC